MRIILPLVVLLYSAAAMAQANPPTVGGKPLVQVKPRGTAAKPQPAKPQSIAVKLQACLEIDDGTKDRLNCYDAVFSPKPKPKAQEPKGQPPKAQAAKAVTDCRLISEEDERLTCYNGFVERLPKLPKSA